MVCAALRGLTLLPETTEFISTDAKLTQRQLDKRENHVMDLWITTTGPHMPLTFLTTLWKADRGGRGCFALSAEHCSSSFKAYAYPQHDSGRRGVVNSFAAIVHIQIAITRLQRPLWFYLVTEKSKNLIIDLRARSRAAPMISTPKKDLALSTDSVGLNRWVARTRTQHEQKGADCRSGTRATGRTSPLSKSRTDGAAPATRSCAAAMDLIR
jgi:hypothetical protein